VQCLTFYGASLKWVGMCSWGPWQQVWASALCLYFNINQASLKFCFMQCTIMWLFSNQTTVPAPISKFLFSKLKILIGKLPGKLLRYYYQHIHSIIDNFQTKARTLYSFFLTLALMIDHAVAITCSYFQHQVG